MPRPKYPGSFPLGNKEVVEVENGWMSEEHRLAAAAAIRQAAEHEKAAVAELTKALAAAS